MTLPTEWLWDTAFTALHLVLILLACWLALYTARVLSSRLGVPRVGSGPFLMEEKRLRTLRTLVHSLARYAIYFVTAVLILQQFHVDTTSLVAGAGIVGLAFGVGAQSLIRDVITGFFIILEDQYAVGDYIVCGDMAGTVEDIGFRVTKLRDGSGMLHILPHSSITRLTNYTRGAMQASVIVPVPQTADLTAAYAALDTVCRRLPQTMPELLETPRIVGIVDWRETATLIRIAAKVQPLKQGAVEAELRYQLQQELQQAGLWQQA